MTRPRSAARTPPRTRAAANEELPADGLATMEGGAAVLATHGLPGLRSLLPRHGATNIDNGWTLFWRGYTNQFDDMALARADWMRAEECFTRGADQAGLDLVACGFVLGVHLDNQSFRGHAARAGRVARIVELPGNAALALFVVGARILIASERCEFGRALGNDIERAFSALVAEIDPNITLRCACAAINAIGRMLDRGRFEDFYLAGTEVAARPELSDYGRALWHLLNAIARWYDTGAAQRARAELDAAERCADDRPGRPLRARIETLRAVIALNDGDAAAARAHLDRAHRLLMPDYEQDYALFHLVRARLAVLVGEFDVALAHATLSLHKTEESEAPSSEIAPIVATLGLIHTALRQYEAAAAAFTRSVELSDSVQARLSRLHVHLTQALSHIQQGAFADARAELLAGFALARSVDLPNFFRLLPAVASELCAAALDLDADVQFAYKVIALRELACPDLGVAAWPWPLRFRFLGSMMLERDGEPLKLSRKAPKRLIDLVRLIAALGGRRVDAVRVAATLWPDSDGDVGRDSLKAMLHRARALLGGNALQLRDGQISFDEQSVWLDTWAFEHVTARIEALLATAGLAVERVDDGELARRRLQLLALYRGHFLGDNEVPAWAMPVRDRLRARFLRCVELLGQRLERLGKRDEAIDLYRTALEQDNLAEELYQLLIACHLARGERSQAASAYRRCRELLSIVLGLRPSARTEALVDGLISR